MSKMPKLSCVLQGNCCETCRNIPKKTLMKEFTKKNSITNNFKFYNFFRASAATSYKKK